MKHPQMTPNFAEGPEAGCTGPNQPDMNAQGPWATVSAHDKGTAADFLAMLDSAATRFTFQLFSDHGEHRAEVIHGSLNEAWPKIVALNTPARRLGVFATINETDFQGRRVENIVRPRALFLDADDAVQLQR